MKYQETINVEIENIASTKQLFWRSIYEVIDDSYFDIVKIFSTTFLNQCKCNPNEHQSIPNEIKADLKNGFGTGVLCKKWLLSAEGSHMIKRRNKR